MTQLSHKRIILVGPACGGKDFIKTKFRERGFNVDVSYTTRPKRENEIDNIDYYFISEKQFVDKISANGFYEHVKHGDYRYGTGQHEWDNSKVFIMESEGVNSISKNDRLNCLVIFVTAPQVVRMKRMEGRGWNNDQIVERIKIDHKKFKNFKNYDLIINSVNEM